MSILTQLGINWCALRRQLGVVFVAGTIVLLGKPARAQLPEQFTIRSALSAPFPTEIVASPSGAIAWVFDAEGVRNVWAAIPPSYAGRSVTSYTTDVGLDIGSPVWRPDGRGMVFVRGEGVNEKGEHPNPALDPRGTRELVMYVNAEGTGLREIGDGTWPTVSPDSRTVVFMRNALPFIVSLTDTSAPQRLFVTRGRIGNLRWSPDGHALAFVSNRGDHSFIGVFDLRTKVLSYLDPDIDSDRYPSWSPDGARIAFVRVPALTRQITHAARRAGNPWSIRVFDLRTGHAAQVWRASTGDGSVFSGFASPDQLLWTAEGRLAFPWERTGWRHVYSVPASGGRESDLTPGVFEVDEAMLARDGRTIVYTSNQGDIDRRHIWSVAASGGAPSILTPGVGIEWAVTPLPDASVAMLRSDAKGPARPAVLRSGTVTDVAAGAIPNTFPNALMVEPRAVTMRAPDGVTVHGQLFEPRGGTSPHAAVVFFHGGSRRQMLLGWNPMGYYTNAYALNQYLASRGYVVLSVNYRSGTGYGLDFREAQSYGPEGGAEARDIAAAVALLKRRPDVDARRVGVWGGSYGGYMTALSLARFPDNFTVGVDFAGVHDWNLEWAKMADTWDESKEMTARHIAFASSPMADLSRWRAPVLLIQGDDDRNVVFSQTVQLAEDLRNRGVHVETLIYPDETHEWLLHEHWVKSYEATAAFLERYLK
ncbi:MAG: prolyl oligopeptidase family serine peptidase [Gemmatimonadota bacterium]|nr:prolyl oligopeptidase family serine peptidase [Gemmatimonadota bacterium]